MAKRTKREDTSLSPEMDELIRVKPEDTQAKLDRLKYTITPRPDEKPTNKGDLWCCYCGRFNKFESKTARSNNGEESWTTYPKCSSCGISIEDFHIKTANRLWQTK